MGLNSVLFDPAGHPPPYPDSQYNPGHFYCSSAPATNIATLTQFLPNCILIQHYVVFQIMYPFVGIKHDD